MRNLRIFIIATFAALTLAVMASPAQAMLSHPTASTPAQWGKVSGTPWCELSCHTYTAWRPAGSTWSRTSRREGIQIYIYPYSSAWAWTWTSGTGWLMMSTQDVLVNTTPQCRPGYACA